MLAIESAQPVPRVSLAVSLFSSCGKLAVEITSLGVDRATVIAEERPLSGSFAILVRNGIKLPARIAWGQGSRIGLTLEDIPLQGQRCEKFRARS